MSRFKQFANADPNADPNGVFECPHRRFEAVANEIPFQDRVVSESISIRRAHRSL